MSTLFFACSPFLVFAMRSRRFNFGRVKKKKKLFRIPVCARACRSALRALCVTLGLPLRRTRLPALGEGRCVHVFGRCVKHIQICARRLVLYGVTVLSHV